MKILVTGANGYLGALLSSELEKSHQVARTSRGMLNHSSTLRLDITDRNETRILFDELKPDVILHAAAIASAVACDANPEEAMRVNVCGTENVVEAANECGARVLLVSSLAARDPSTVYGQSKREAETRVRSAAAGFEILQLSMTFGASPNKTANRPFNKIRNTLYTGFPEYYDNCWKFHPTDAEHVRIVIEEIIQKPFSGRTLPVTTSQS
jgi:dTDP-4-dehydrorhamnose reductase